MSRVSGDGVKPKAAAKIEKPVTLIELEPKHIQLTVIGITPLIVHAWSVKAIREMEDNQQKKAKKGREAKDPEEQFRGCLYLDDQNRNCFPARAFKQACVSAATSIDDKRFPKTKIRQAIFFLGDLLPIIHPYEPDMRTDPVRLNGKVADIRYRPEFKEWEIVLSIDYNAAVVTMDQVVNLVNLAGFAVGIGEWRPERNGTNGRFRVKSAVE